MSESLEKANTLAAPIIPTSRIPLKPKLAYRHGRIPHLIAILALLINLALLLFAYAGSAAVSSSSSSSSMADATYMFIAHRPFEVDGKQLDDEAVRAVPRYGLSPFKACRYTMMREDLVGNGTCVGSDWALKGELGRVDEGDEMAFSDALAHVFPWASHLINIMVLLNIYHLHLLLLAYRHPTHHALLTLETYPSNINHTPAFCVEQQFVLRSRDKESRDGLSFAHVRYRKAQALYIRLRSRWPQDFWVQFVSDGLGAVVGVVLVCAYSLRGEGKRGEMEVEPGPALYA